MKLKLENLKGRDYLEELCADGRIILKFVSKNKACRYGLDSSGSEQVPVGSFYGHAN
jgi:hypothetical protein